MDNDLKETAMRDVESGRRSNRADRRRSWSLLSALAALALVAGACSQDTAESPTTRDPIRLLESADFADFIDANPEVDLINVHIPYQGHIAGTDEFVDFSRILEHEGLPTDLDEAVVLYCRSGNMSGQAADDLAAAGYTNIVDLSGGMNAWEASGRDLLTDDPGSS